MEGRKTVEETIVFQWELIEHLHVGGQCVLVSERVRVPEKALKLGVT